MRLILDIDRAQVTRAALRLRQREERASDWRPAFGRIHGAFLASQGRTYATGSAWRPDLPETVRQKAQEGHDTRTMHETGALARSLTSTGPGHVHRATRDSLTMGTSVPYAKWLARQGRDPVIVTAADRAEWVRILRDHLRGSLR